MPFLPPNQLPSLWACAPGISPSPSPPLTHTHTHITSSCYSLPPSTLPADSITVAVKKRNHNGSLLGVLPNIPCSNSISIGFGFGFRGFL